MDEVAEKVLDHIKSVGKTSGGKIQAELDLSEGAYKRAKDELKGAGLVILGRGRGGTIQAIEGAEPPPEPKKLSKAESMAIAREEKLAKSKEQKKRNDIRAKARQLGEKELGETDIPDQRIQVLNIWGEFIVEDKNGDLWKGVVDE